MGDKKMREIKFRFWLGETVVDPKVLVIHNGRVCVRHTKTNDLLEDANIIAEQFTGFTDKIGKEIYEGDIVNDRSGRVMQIVFRQYKLVFKAILPTDFLYADFDQWLDNRDKTLNVEVIGNIHENPELLF